MKQRLCYTIYAKSLKNYQKNWSKMFTATIICKHFKIIFKYVYGYMCSTHTCVYMYFYVPMCDHVYTYMCMHTSTFLPGIKHLLKHSIFMCMLASFFPSL